MTDAETIGRREKGRPRAERHEAGKALRHKVPREAHADCPPASERDPVAILAETDAERIPELLPIRYKRMAASPFYFFRGAAAVMAHDLAQFPQLGVGANVQACGDCHLMNFGAFSSAEGRALFDINDFDETLPGVDFTIDLKRLATSVAVAARDAHMPDKKARAIARSAVKAYRDFMLDLAEKTPLEVWYISMEIEKEVLRIEDAKLRERLLSTLVKAKKDLAADDNFPHLAEETGGEAHIEDRPPLIYHFTTETEKAQKIHAHSAFSGYGNTLLPERRALFERYALRDLAMKVVGVGSVGTYCAVGLFMTPDEEPMFLQVKEALHSVLEKIAPPSDEPRQQGRRVVEGQRALQAASDLFLGWTKDVKSHRQFYVRRLKNRRLGSIGEVIEAKALEAYANLCGRTLARAHARTGDPALIAGYMGKSDVLDDALASFAMAYAAQTDHDHALLVAAIDKSTGLPRARLSAVAE
ncbi:DUF2252 domain-containing protein [Methylocapsa acidiphila]|uniref:DUF2252 domain-containing protein n=1 Tax=Methylocapsa acidiphila TaxID=133552 RepID=UPI0003FDFD76|nr:DUF2252 domain-containing protein [Methylocapsa acidiphila]